jgi:hypothetical protein
MSVRRPPTSSSHLPRQQIARPQTDSLADLLERVLDKGVVVAGDIVVNLLDIELLTLKVRLLICSADTAQDMGIDFWSHDPYLSGGARRRQLDQADQEGRTDGAEQPALQERIERLEQQIAQREARDGG